MLFSSELQLSRHLLISAVDIVLAVDSYHCDNVIWHIQGLCFVGLHNTQNMSRRNII